ncbi:2-isopropylmalate synthase [Paenibacillus crassostreae]|uniref:2-isopropylmalate synthase n=1 Tax=Paenibacillus crassostreae TaxID=1763538 RepID=A0A167AH90_9BACL|nr:2-isopropylmalate synthase [Paenibacillus crassostreae]AOZ92302.1 2-isopropylmalate synthase [Paenibacillus crassostreae]OAB71019.1 2-isopropylmalate synthase [Paenibacillus crassostreae]
MQTPKISIFDTTLRDGEQAPGASLQPDQKVQLAAKIVELGIDVLEPGFPISSPGEFAAVETISRKFQQVEICGFARALKGDIDAAVRATKDAERRRIHLFLSSSDIHLKYQLRKSRKEVVAMAREMTAYAKQFNEQVEFTAMDAARTGIDDLIEMIEVVIEEGATMINLPDTVGYALPHEYGEMFRKVREGARGGAGVRYSAHCHNDLGLAVANSLAAIQNGASQIEVTVNGVGERTGNCALEELVMALEVRKDVLNYTTGISLEKIYGTSRAVSSAMHFPMAYNKPIVGRNAFQHESGIHQDGLLKDLSTYEIMRPESLGISRNMIILGKHSGRHALKDRVARYGVKLNEEEMEVLYGTFKETADQLKIVSDDLLLKMVSHTTGKRIQNFELGEVRVQSSSEEDRIATVTLHHLHEDRESTHTASGKGPLEALISAISDGIDADIIFGDLEMHSLSTGEEAHAEAAVTVEWEGKNYRGTAIHQDIVMAAGLAYVAACNSALSIISKA